MCRPFIRTRERSFEKERSKASENLSTLIKTGDVGTAAAPATTSMQPVPFDDDERQLIEDLTEAVETISKLQDEKQTLQSDLTEANEIIENLQE